MGIVYYKQVVAQQSSGGYTAGQVIASPLTRDLPGDGSLGGARKQVTLATTTAATVYSGNIAAAPVRAYKLNVNIAGVGFGSDDGQGNILGFGFSGTIVYATGAWTITLQAAPTAGILIQAIYDVDVDSTSTLDAIQGSLLTKDIRAQVWAIKSDVGAFANFAFSQRFGRSAIDEVAQDLSTELTRTLNTNVISALVANVPVASASTWISTPPTGVSYAEHKLTFIDAIAEAEAILHLASGAPTANRYIAGRTAAAVLRGMPDFKIASDAASVSVGLYGYYDGIPVIRATGVLADGDLMLLSNAGNYFNAPIAYAPFMPLN